MKKYTGTDGIEYRGRAVKARKTLEQRQKNHSRIIAMPHVGESGYNKPGSMKCRKN